MSEKIENGVIVTLEKKENDGPKKVRLQVVNDKIIRVTATAEDNFKDQESLIIIDQKTKP